MPDNIRFECMFWVYNVPIEKIPGTFGLEKNQLFI